MQSYNFFLQRELPGGFSGSVGYVGTRTVHENVLYLINAGEPGLGQHWPSARLTSGYVVDETFIEPVGNTNYNALQARLDRKLTQACR